MNLAPFINAVATKVVAPLFTGGPKLLAKGLMKTIDSPPLPKETSALTFAPQTKVARDIQSLDYKLSDLTLKDWMEYLGKIGMGVGVGVGLFGDE